jgi:serine/threonine-protein kinase
MSDTESITVVGEIETSGEHTIVDRTDPVIGVLLAGRFRILEKIAAGGFGAIYRATHAASGRDVAIKIMHASHAADSNVVARFRREGTTLQRLCAPHTVETYEFGETADGTLYIVMELLRGHTLHRRLEHGALPWREALAIAVGAILLGVIAGSC